MKFFFNLEKFWNGFERYLKSVQKCEQNKQVLEKLWKIQYLFVLFQGNGGQFCRNYEIIL